LVFFSYLLLSISSLVRLLNQQDNFLVVTEPAGVHESDDSSSIELSPRDDGRNGEGQSAQDQRYHPSAPVVVDQQQQDNQNDGASNGNGKNNASVGNVNITEIEGLVSLEESQQQTTIEELNNGNNNGIQSENRNPSGVEIGDDSSFVSVPLDEEI
jgi:hypothetical protein